MSDPHAGDPLAKLAQVVNWAKDARTEVGAVLGRIQRIAQAHGKNRGPAGTTSGYCDECERPWPCPTYRWATGEGDPGISTWTLED